MWTGRRCGRPGSRADSGHIGHGTAIVVHHSSLVDLRGRRSLEFLADVPMPSSLGGAVHLGMRMEADLRKLGRGLRVERQCHRVRCDATGLAESVPAISPSASAAAVPTPSPLPTPMRAGSGRPSRRHRHEYHAAPDTGHRAGWDVCAIRQDGTLGCWGTEPFPRRDVHRAGSADGSACAIREDGSLACWGHDRRRRAEGRVHLDQRDAGSRLRDPTRRRGLDLLAFARRGDGRGGGSSAGTRTATDGPVHRGQRRRRVRLCPASGRRARLLDGPKPARATFRGVPDHRYQAVDLPCAIQLSGALVCFSLESESGSRPPEGDGFIAVSATTDRGCALRRDGLSDAGATRASPTMAAAQPWRCAPRSGRSRPSPWVERRLRDSSRRARGLLG